MDRALLAGLRRQQELLCTEALVEHIEDELEAAGTLGRPGRVPAMVFLDLVGYTRLTEEQGDAAAAQLAESLAVLVDRSAREHGGVPIKWLGDGVMVHFREPAGACGRPWTWSRSCPRLDCRRPMSGWRPGLTIFPASLPGAVAVTGEDLPGAGRGHHPRRDVHRDTPDIAVP